MEPRKNFIIEKLSWYHGKVLHHDPKLKFTILVRFLEDNQLTTRNLLLDNGEISDDFVLYLEDVTELGYKLLQGGYQRWIKAIDIGTHPSKIYILVRALNKLKSS